MSSGTRFEPYAAKQLQSGLAPELLGKVARLGLSPRQQELNRLWAAYRGAQYNSRRIDWDGTERAQGIDAEAIASQGYIPPGYYDAGATFPVKFRRPSLPYHLRRVIVDRFTGLLFSDRKHPVIRVEGDSISEDYIRTLAEVSRLWPAMIMTRTYGGAMGSTATGFQFVDGKPVVEVHDPRWCIPTFEDRHALRLSSLEKRYMFPVDERDPETGEWIQRPYWYRRIIDQERDILFKAIPVSDEVPDWEVEREVVHGFGFCPVVWTQNIPVQDDIDGDSDCLGIEDMCEQIDALLSQANQGILASCDPTLRIITDAELDSVRKGSKNALKLPQGSSADYMEISGHGIKAAMDMVQQLRIMALEVAQCVLDQPGQNAASRKTATEIERMYASMLAKADVLREQYGERCVKPLLEMMVKAVRIVEKPRAVEGMIVRQEVKLPLRLITKDDLSTERVARKLSDDGDIMINLNWGPYFNPSLDEAFKAVQSVTTARLGGLLDHEHAVAFTAPYFLVEDARAMARKVQQESTAMKNEVDDQLMAGLSGSEWGESKLTQATQAAKLVPPLPPDEPNKVAPESE